MNIYKNMYLHLFNKISDALDGLANLRDSNIEEIKETLKMAQINTEEMYISSNHKDD
ncbi:MAG: hypothetical protein RSB38_02715 [Oscillospiraceae bacterium]